MLSEEQGMTDERYDYDDCVSVVEVMDNYQKLLATHGMRHENQLLARRTSLTTPSNADR